MSKTCKWCGGEESAPRHDFDDPNNHAAAKHVFDPKPEKPRSQMFRQDPETGAFVEMTGEEIAAYMAEAKIKEEQRIAEKGHDCNDFVTHDMFVTSRGGLQDSYSCGKCGDLLQVG